MNKLYRSTPLFHAVQTQGKYNKDGCLIGSCRAFRNNKDRKEWVDELPNPSPDGSYRYAIKSKERDSIATH